MLCMSQLNKQLFNYSSSKQSSNRIVIYYHRPNHQLFNKTRTFAKQFDDYFYRFQNYLCLKQDNTINCYMFVLLVTRLDQTIQPQTDTSNKISRLLVKRLLNGEFSLNKVFFFHLTNRHLYLTWDAIQALATKLSPLRVEKA